jgi:HEAT repeat protein
MKNIGIKFAAVAFVIGAAVSPAFAGKGGSADLIRDAIRTTSADAIIAEVERAESLICSECVTLVTALTDHNDLRVREVAAWWIAKRPGLKNQLVPGFKADLVNGDSLHVRNAADFLGRSSTFTALPELRTAIKRTGLTVDAKLAIVRATLHLANLGGNEVLTTAMADTNPSVRIAAAKAWRDIRGQQDATPVMGLLTDGDAGVRAEAASVLGGMRFAAAKTVLEQLVVNDASQLVRKNAAWALGKIGSQTSRASLTIASNDKSQYVRMTARAALSSLK